VPTWEVLSFAGDLTASCLRLDGSDRSDLRSNDKLGQHLTQSLHPRNMHRNKRTAAVIYSLCSNKRARHFLASGSIATADPAFVKLLIGSYHTVAASLYALSLDADGGGIGATWGTIHNLCRKKAVGCSIRRCTLLRNCIRQRHQNAKYGQLDDLQHPYF